VASLRSGSQRASTVLEVPKSTAKRPVMIQISVSTIDFDFEGRPLEGSRRRL
jgi:hypothetical protein